MSIGPVMLDLQGLALQQEEKEILAHPSVGGVILFARNYESPDQLQELVRDIQASRDTSPLIAVDQEGGRVQRFQEGFSRLPPLKVFGQRYQKNPDQARRAAQDVGWLMASELRAWGVDFSFAPVLDLDIGV
ncbi:MAG: glycoside hydrolase family 3 N-terminal domain-containing protein, partial [bacterium]